MLAIVAVLLVLLSIVLLWAGGSPAASGLLGNLAAEALGLAGTIVLIEYFVIIRERQRNARYVWMSLAHPLRRCMGLVHELSARYRDDSADDYWRWLRVHGHSLGAYGERIRDAALVHSSLFRTETLTALMEVSRELAELAMYANGPSSAGYGPSGGSLHVLPRLFETIRRDSEALGALRRLSDELAKALVLQGIPPQTVSTLVKGQFQDIDESYWSECKDQSRFTWLRKLLRI